MTNNRKYLDFEIIKEPWNKYSLKDGSKLKTRVMLTAAWHIEENGIREYSVEIETFNIFMCDPSLQGTKNQTRYTEEQIRKNIEVDDSRYTTISYETNEYLLDDNTRIIIHSNIEKINRTRLFDENGDRIYDISMQASVTITPPKQIV